MDKEVMETYLLSERALPSEIFDQEHIKRLRLNVSDLITQITDRDNLHSSVAYLALHYFDRFVSKSSTSVPILRNRSLSYRWKSLAICCLALACKFSNDKIFPGRTSYGINSADLMKVEFSILEALEWRMHSITALIIADYFLLTVPLQCNPKALNINEIVVQSQGDIRFTKYKPSEIAASAVRASYFDINPTGIVDFGIKLEQTRLEECTKIIKSMLKRNKIPVQKLVLNEGFSFKLKWMNHVGEEDMKLQPNQYREHNKNIMIELGPITISSGSFKLHRVAKITFDVVNSSASDYEELVTTGCFYEGSPIISHIERDEVSVPVLMKQYIPGHFYFFELALIGEKQRVLELRLDCHRLYVFHFKSADSPIWVELKDWRKGGPYENVIFEDAKEIPLPCDYTGLGSNRGVPLGQLHTLISIDNLTAFKCGDCFNKKINDVIRMIQTFPESMRFHTIRKRISAGYKNPKGTVLDEGLIDIQNDWEKGSEGIIANNSETKTQLEKYAVLLNTGLKV